MKMNIVKRIQDLATDVYNDRVGAVVEGDSELASWLQDAHDKLVLVAHDLTEGETVTWEEVFDDIEDDTDEPEERDESPSERRADTIGGLMRERGLSAEDVADATGLGERTVRNIIAARTNRPHEKTLRVLEEFFNLTEGQLDG